MIFSEVDNDKEYINNSMAIGTGLFELYLALQSISKYFHNYGKLCSTLFIFLCRLGSELFPGQEAARELFEV